MHRSSFHHGGLNRLKKMQAGFTLIELLLVIGISTVLFGLISFDLGRAQKSSSLSSTVQELEADIKSQQLKAMAGATEGRSTSDAYGVYVQTGSYTLFHGMSYTPNDHSNFVVSTSSDIALSSTLPNGLLIFYKASGEMAGYAAGQNTITVTDKNDNSTKTITLNQLGVITSVQ